MATNEGRRPMTDEHKAALEEAFVGAAAAYGSRKRITHASWRQLGVPASVLRRAGITR